MNVAAEHCRTCSTEKDMVRKAKALKLVGVETENQAGSRAVSDVLHGKRTWSERPKFLGVRSTHAFER